MSAQPLKVCSCGFVHGMVDHIQITGAPRLDPIQVFMQDFGGSGRITIECYGKAWSAYFGGIGVESLRKFIATSHPEYLANKLTSGKQSKTDAAYLDRIARAVIDAVHGELRKGETP